MDWMEKERLRPAGLADALHTALKNITEDPDR